MEEKYYKVTIDCTSREVAEDIQDWVNCHFHCGEVTWNAISEKSITY